MSAYAPWLIPAGIALIAWVAYRLITASNELDTALKDAFAKQDEKEMK